MGPLDFWSVVAGVAMHYPEVSVIDIETPGQINGDPEQLEQVVISLLENACKHSRVGSRVRVHLRSESGGVLLQVADESIGPHVCRQIVQQHGGRFWAESDADGPGSTFNVWLPCRPMSLGSALSWSPQSDSGVQSPDAFPISRRPGQIGHDAGVA